MLPSQAVLAAVSHNVPAADLLLREMEQHQAPSGSDSDEDTANPRFQQITLTPQPRDEPPASTHSPQTAKAPAPPTARSMPRRSSGKSSKQPDEEDSADVDLYYKHRGEALKLSRRWHKKLHQSANAFAAGQHSGACCQHTL